MRKTSRAISCLVAVLVLTGIISASPAAAGEKAMPDIILKNNAKIDNCAERGIDDYVIFIYSRYCPHCKKAMPVVEDIVTREKIGSRYLPVDTSTDEGREVLKQFGISVQYVPTLVKDCTAYVGAKKPEDYEMIITGKKK